MDWLQETEDTKQLQNGIVNTIAETEFFKMLPNYTKGERLQEYLNKVDRIYSYLVTMFGNVTYENS